MKIKIFFWSITVALAGFLFGFDTIVISGAEQTLQELWKDYTLFGSNDNFHGYIVVGSALFGTIFGALFGSSTGAKPASQSSSSYELTGMSSMVLTAIR